MPILGLPSVLLLPYLYLWAKALSVSPASLQAKMHFTYQDRWTHQAPSYLVLQKLFHGCKTQSFGGDICPRAEYFYLGLICFFQSLLITGRIEENTTCAPEFFGLLPRALKFLLIDLGLFVAASLVPT